MQLKAKCYQRNYAFYHNSGNSRDQPEIVHILEISHFIKQPYNEFHLKNHLESIIIALMMLHRSKIK